MEPFPVAFPDGSVWLVHTPRCKPCAAMDVVQRYRDKQAEHEKADDPQFLTKVMYADGRYAWVEPKPDEPDE